MIVTAFLDSVPSPTSRWSNLSSSLTATSATHDSTKSYIRTPTQIEQKTSFSSMSPTSPMLPKVLHNISALRTNSVSLPVGNLLVATGLLSAEGFLRFLLSEDNSIVSADKFDLSHDMEQPLCHYFVNSSHNTYLTGK